MNNHAAKPRGHQDNPPAPSMPASRAQKDMTSHDKGNEALKEGDGPAGSGA